MLAAHDWGGIVASHFTSIYPEMVEKLILINIPFFTAFLRHLQQSWGQTRKSWWDWGCWRSWAWGSNIIWYLGTDIYIEFETNGAILQIIFSDAFLYEVVKLRHKFYWNVFARVQLTIKQHYGWCRSDDEPLWLGANQVINGGLVHWGIWPHKEHSNTSPWQVSVFCENYRAKIKRFDCCPLSRIKILLLLRQNAVTSCDPLGWHEWLLYRF